MGVLIMGAKHYASGAHVDLFIENQRILLIDSDLSPLIRTGVEVIDASGLTVAPGLVDTHCHLRDPGQLYKEDIFTGTKSALAGGFTTICCMPNTSPALDNSNQIVYIKEKAKVAKYPNLYPVGAITLSLQGERLTDFKSLKNSGAIALSDDGKPIINAGILKSAFLAAKESDMMIMSHCEDVSLISDCIINFGPIAKKFGFLGTPNSSESSIVARELVLAKETGARLHLCHISTKESVELIRKAKIENVNVTAETCPHYFSLSDESITELNANFKMNPPLRNKDDVSAIIYGLIDGTIDNISTDHAPHAPFEKTNFKTSPCGIIGFETALSVGLTYLVKPGHLSMKQLFEKMSINPSKILNLKPVKLQCSDMADIILFNDECKYKVDIEHIYSKSKNTPFENQELIGKIVYTVLNGEVHCFN